MSLIFLSLVGTCVGGLGSCQKIPLALLFGLKDWLKVSFCLAKAFFLYISVYGSAFFQDIDLSNQMSSLAQNPESV